MNQRGNKIKPDVYLNWTQRVSTRRLMALESGWLRDAISPFRGLHMAYAGVDLQPRFLRSGRCHHSFRLGFQWQKGVVDAQTLCKDSHWPLADEGVDLVVLQHALDMSRRPHQLIREACRTLVPNGYLVVVGLNPLSWWGGLRLCSTFSSDLPWVANPVTPARLQDWLMLLDFRVEYIEHIAHVWPLKVASERVSRRIDRILANKGKVPGNAYIMVARKTVAGMTAIREKRWRRTPAGFTMPAPAVRQPEMLQLPPYKRQSHKRGAVS